MAWAFARTLIPTGTTTPEQPTNLSIPSPRLLIALDLTAARNYRCLQQFNSVWSTISFITLLPYFNATGNFNTLQSCSNSCEMPRCCLFRFCSNRRNAYFFVCVLNVYILYAPDAICVHPRRGCGSSVGHTWGSWPCATSGSTSRGHICTRYTRRYDIALHCYNVLVLYLYSVLLPHIDSIGHTITWHRVVYSPCLITMYLTQYYPCIVVLLPQSSYVISLG